MTQNQNTHSYFDGTNPNFPDLSATPWFAEIAERCAVLARSFRFRFIGPEHLMHELLSEDGFRALIQSAGGDPDICRGALSRSFRDHAQFSSPSDSLGITDRLRQMLDRLDQFIAGPDGEHPEAVLAELYLSAIKSCDGSMLAEGAIQDCGAGSLLLDLEDISFMDSQMGYNRELDRFSAEGHIETAAPITEEDFYHGMPDGDMFQPGGDLNRPLDELLGRIEKQQQTIKDAPEVKAETAKPAAKAAETRGKYGTGASKDEEVAADVNACLRNLGEMAALGDIDPVVGRDAEIDTILSALRRRRKSSVIISGEAGVGKTAIAEGLALRLRSNLIEQRLAARPFYELALQDLVAGTKYRGDFEARMQHLIKRLIAEKAIVFIDEFHMIIGSGSTYGRGMDGANMLKTALGRGEITVIGATTPAEMRELRRDAALMRRFETLQILEPTRDETLAILRGASWSYLAHHQIGVKAGALEEICRLTDLYQPDRRFPDKAFDLLDAACVVCAEEYEGIEAEVPELEIRHVLAASDKLGLRRPRMPGAEVVAMLNGIETAIPAALGAQGAPARQLADAARAAAVNLHPGGVRANFLIAGPASAEPERFARAFAGQMQLPFIRIDLSQMRDLSQIYQLVGLPNAVGPDRTGRLVEAGDGHKDMVLWLWGLEQAAPAVQEFISETVINGSFRAADGRTVSLRGAWVLTGLINDPDQEGGRIGFGSSGSDDNHDAALRRMLSAELLDGYDAVIRLEHPAESAATTNARSAVEGLIRAIADLGGVLEVDEDVVRHLGRNTRENQMRRELNDLLRAPIIRRLLEGERQFSVSLRDGAYHIG